MAVSSMSGPGSHISGKATQYGPLTKSIDIDEMLMLIDLTREFETVSAWEEEALFRLPQGSRRRRKEIVRSARRKFLEIEDDSFVRTPLVALLNTQRLTGRVKRDLLLAQYLRTTPLVFDAINEIVLPRAEEAARPLANPDDSIISLEDWQGFLDSKLNTTTPSTVAKTRSHITAHLTKFGLLQAQHTAGNHFDKRFSAHFYEPEPSAFWFSLALEFAEHGWTSRSLDYVTNQSWTRVAYCAQPAYVRFVMQEAERSALVVTDFFGSERQVTFRDPDFVANVVEAIRYGR